MAPRSGPMEMKTTIFPYGAPECQLATTALAQIAQSYGLPFFGFGGATDAKFPDAQAGIEAAFQLTVQALSGANLIHDCGWMDHGCIASPSYMVLVHEVTMMVDSFAKGVPISEDSLALDLIDKVGPGGHYLSPRSIRYSTSARCSIRTFSIGRSRMNGSPRGASDWTTSCATRQRRPCNIRRRHCRRKFSRN